MTIQLSEIWLDYGAKLKAFLYARVSDKSEADDLLQEILLKVHRNLAQLQTEVSLQSWLFQIAQNTIVDHYRSQARASHATK